MMKNCFNQSLAFSLVAAISILATTGEVKSQVNEKRIQGEASGTYRGSRTGGVATFSEAFNLSPDFVVTPPTYTGKFKVPVASRKPKISLSLAGQLPGDGTAVYRGKRSRADVSRNGTLISYQAVSGTGTENDGQPSYTDGTTVGKFTKKGTKWTTKLKMSASQTSRVTSVEDPFATKVVSNTKITGKL